MRRVTVHKPRKQTDARRAREEAEKRPGGRPEIRRDIARVWWPDG
ncbi:hypothetical protein SUDANB58_01093 [Streptomyces sp. enrichment culture]